MKTTLHLVLAFSLALAGSTASATQFYTSEDYEDFLSSLAPDYHHETFPSLTPDEPEALGLTYLSEGNGYSWSLSGGVEPLLAIGNSQVSVAGFDDVFVFTFTGQPVFAFGGSFYGTDFDGAPVSTPITFITNTSESTTVNTTLASPFIGVITETPLEWVMIQAPAAGVWVTTNQVYTAAIPEPATTALLLGGLALAIGLWWRRRPARLSIPASR